MLERSASNSGREFGIRGGLLMLSVSTHSETCHKKGTRAICHFCVAHPQQDLGRHDLFTYGILICNRDQKWKSRVAGSLGRHAKKTAICRLSSNGLVAPTVFRETVTKTRAEGHGRNRTPSSLRIIFEGESNGQRTSSGNAHARGSSPAPPVETGSSRQRDGKYSRIPAGYRCGGWNRGRPD